MEAVLFLVLGFIGLRLAYDYHRNRKIKQAEEAFRLNLNNLFNGMKEFSPAGATQLRADSAIAIDVARAKLCIVRAEWGAALTEKIWNRDQILRVDLVENKQFVRRTSTDRGSQILGASIGNLLMGRTGAVIGGLSGDRVTKGEDAVYQMDLVIAVKDFAEPIQIVSFLGTEERCRKDSPRYRDLSLAASQWHARVSQLIKAC